MTGGSMGQVDDADDVRLVVAATDRAEGGDRAVRWAARLAARHNADLVLVRVLLPPVEAQDQLECQGDLDTFAHTIAGVRARARAVVADDPAAAIVTVAAEEHADVLVVGNSGMRGRREFLLGNVANRITHSSRCTTVVVQSTDPEDVPPPPPPRAPRRAARAVEILRVLNRHGLREMITERATGERAREHARRLRAALEELGPTFSKLGQVLSTRPDLLPSEYIEELATLQDNVTPMTEAEVVAVMEHELGVPWEDVFEAIESEPLAAGTIGQVHRARLADGHRVVVKVQRPSAAETIERDLALLATVTHRISASRRIRSLIDLETLVEQLSNTLRAELDFTKEAEHLERMADVLDQFPILQVPRCHRELTTKRLLVMDEVVDGIPVNEIPIDSPRGEVAREMLAGWFHQILAAGFFHADPHPGNLLWAGDRIWLLDLGMVGELDDDTRRRLLLLLLAFWQGDVGFLADLVLASASENDLAGVSIADFEASLGELVESVRGTSLRDLELGPLLEQITEISLRHGVPVPTSLALVGKALTQVQLTVSELAPDLDILEEARRFFVRDIFRRFVDRGDPAKWMYEAEKLRHRVSTIADAFAAAGGARPGRRLEVGFASERLERTVLRAGRGVAFGLAGGFAWLGAAIAASSGRAPRWIAPALAAAGTGLTATAVADAARASAGRKPVTIDAHVSMGADDSAP